MTKKEKTTGEKIDAMTDKIQEVASELWGQVVGRLYADFESGAEETKKAASSLKKWRDKSSTEEITTTILGGVLLLLALWELRMFIWGVLLLLAGVLCVTGYFNPLLRDLLEKVEKKADSKQKKTSKSEEEND